MPELPDLQAFSRNLTRLFSGQIVKKVAVYVSRKMNVSESALQKALEGKKVEQFKRDGKELHVLFQGGHELGLHLMLHGKLVLFGETEELPRFSILVLSFRDGRSLALTDFQKAARVTLDPPPAEVPDALTVDPGYLARQLSGSRRAVKTVLMDQKVIRGIGNTYADEILWAARISPFSVAKQIPAAKVKKLAASIHSVLRNAEKKILETNPEIIGGEIRDFLEIHNRNNKHTSSGAPIHRKPISGRKTYFTDEQQFFG